LLVCGQRQYRDPLGHAELLAVAGTTTAIADGANNVCKPADYQTYYVLQAELLAVAEALLQQQLQQHIKPAELPYYASHHQLAQLHCHSR
jgi:hypothetical protein